MEQETRVEGGISRRRFLQLGGLVGLTLGALSLPSRGWGEVSDSASESAEEDRRLAHRGRSSKKRRSRRRSKTRAGKARRKQGEQTPELSKAKA